MSDTPNSRRGSAKPGGEAGILASLPNSRPQRPSARRARQTGTRVAVASPSVATAKARTSKAPKPAAGSTAASKATTSKLATPSAPSSAAAKPAGRKPAMRKPAAPKPVAPKPTTRKPTSRKAAPPKSSRAKRTTADKTIQPPAPRQGFEAGSEVEQGLAVGPPSGLEVAGSVVGLLGEVAQAGLSSGGRLLKGAVSRLAR